jgi:hypothetical protein
MRILPVAVLAAVVATPSASADIGIRGVSPRHVHPGEVVRVTADGFLGPEPWPAMPIVIVAEQHAPRPYQCGNGYCSPRMARGRLGRPPYRLLGAIRRWRRQSDGHGIGSLRFTVPRLRSGRYVLGLFCESCVRGPKGSLIIDRRLVLHVL